MLTPERLTAPERITTLEPEELRWFADMRRRGKPVKVYRGGTIHSAVGFSWTVRRSTAEEAARAADGAPVVAVGRIYPESIITLIDLLHEREIVAFPEHVRIERLDHLKEAA